ncbi:MAG TPA: hypothetical protein VF941_00085 [Clostridia bacterium]
MDFKGIDWTELSIYFGIIEKDYEGGNDKAVLEETKEYLKLALYSDKEVETANSIRLFVQKLYSNSNGVKANAPIWKGLSEVRESFTIIKYTIILLEQMWY